VACFRDDIRRVVVRIYHYTEFDVAAFFTKEESDNGIDKDGNGLFDILQN